MKKIIDLNSPEVSSVIDKLLVDKTTGKNIIFAEDDYLAYDKLALREAQITKGFISKYGDEYVTPRVKKHIKLQSDRTRENAEVFTPSWICNQMINYIDEDWFGYKDVFNKKRGESWTPKKGKIDFKDKNWKSYVESIRLEITCGEAPYLVSRYDTSDGKLIPLEKRIGILDRKIRVVNENVKDEKEWLDWVFAAYKSVYGYEFQGDNLLIARINLYLTFIEYLKAQFNRNPNDKEVEKLIDIICWNIFQMDGLKYITPFGNAKPKSIQMTIFDNEKPTKKHTERFSDVKIFNWIYNKEVLFKDIRKDGNKMKFDYIIGNPPYQDNTIGENETFAPPVYDKFIDSSINLTNKLELIHPARFLFNAGSTSKSWNKKMLNDSHYKILKYFNKSSDVFINTDIKGGIAISYYDCTKKFKEIGVFTPHDKLNSICAKVSSNNITESLSSIVDSAYSYHFTELLYVDHPELKNKLSKGHEYDLKSNVFDVLDSIFHDKKINKEDVRVLGRKNNQRAYKYIDSKYINKPESFYAYKVILPGATGTGKFGELLNEPVVAYPTDANTESFLSIGTFKNKEECLNCIKYIKCKFSRCLLGVRKATQALTPGKWEFVPIQNFSSDSDIDWNKNISEIDAQLYKKYKLSKEEIAFIESKVKEMK